MKKFIKYLIGVVVILAAIMILADASYTYVYSTAKPRNTFQYILRLKPQKIDYVFLGSSRTANHIAAADISKMTGRKAVNFGVEGAGFEDNLLQLKLLIHQGVKIEKVFLQVDYLFESEDVSNIANAAALPFIRNPIVKEHLEARLTNFNSMYYIPFYRYLVTDHKIGFREFFFTVLNKKPEVDPADGFAPKIGNTTLKTYMLPDTIAQRNLAVDEIIALCKSKQIEIVLFCAPFCSYTRNIDYISKLKMKLPEMHDYSRSMPDSFFYNCGHLNENGARSFTKMLTEDCILHQPLGY